MKILRKLISLLLAGVILVGAVTVESVTAFAEDSKPELITVSLADIDAKAEWIHSLGRDLYFAGNDKTGYRAVYLIGEKQLANWRKSGKLTPKHVTLEPAIFKKACYVYSPNCFEYCGDYAVFYIGEYKKDLSMCVVRYDEKECAIKEVFRTASSYDYVGVRSDGTVLYSTYNSARREFNYYLKDSTGKTKRSFTLNNWGVHTYFKTFEMDCNFASFVTITSSDSFGSIKLISKEGEITDVQDNGQRITDIGQVRGGVDFDFIAGTYDKYYRRLYVYSKDGTKAYDVISVDDGYYVSSYGTELYGTRAIITISQGDIKNYDFSKDVLAIGDIAEGSVLSKRYNAIYTSDRGKMFTFEDSGTEKGKAGFMDIDGNELARFDYAGTFVAKYAPVADKTGIYLIDRDMKQFSASLNVGPIDSFITLGDELFYYASGNDTVLFTYKETAAAPAKTKVSAKVSGSKMKISWKKVTGAEKYQIYYSTDGKNFKLLKTVAGSKTSYTVSAKKGTTYYIKVRSYITDYGNKVYSKYSNTVKVKR